MIAIGSRRMIQPERGMAAALAVAALVGAYAAATYPILSMQAVVAAGVVAAVLVTRLPLGTAALAASFYFDDYLSGGEAFLNPGKMVGALAVAIFAIEWFQFRDRIRWSPQLTAIVGIGLSLILSFAVARDQARAILISSRYVMFFLLFFLILQTVRRRRDADLLADVLVVAAGWSALLGLRNYLFVEGFYRAGGPIGDPGDFGFLLATTIPLALYRIGSAPPVRRVVAGAATLLMFAAVLMSFSRAALLGLAAAGAWALATRRLALRWGVIALAGIVVAGFAAYLVQPQLVQTSFELKQNVAQRNVDSRFTLWRVAGEQYSSSPLVGIGPGNYESRYVEFEYPAYQVETTHNAYLHVGAELGTVGLVAFCGYLAVSWLALRRRVADAACDQLVGALAAGFVVALVGAMFMTQQFYSPMWFLPALAVAVMRLSSDEAVTTDHR
jgi:putative inorganic carbon (hco3(-)) transporter